MTADLRELLLSPEGRLYYLETFVKIPMKDSEGIRVPFKAWDVQRDLMLGLTGMDAVVKDAQLGITSIISGDMMVRSFVPDTTTVIIAHKGFTTERLLHRVQVMYESIPEEVKPKIDHQSASELRFPDINSVIYIATAREEVAGRGEPIHQLLLSECAFYPPEANKKIIIPALQRVPRGGRVVKESTPNGEDPVLYAEVEKALRGESDYKLHVLFWWKNPDNWIPPTFRNIPDCDREGIAETYDEKERQLIEAHGLKPSQVRWRRWKIRQAGELFFQEHPESLDTCFLISGESFYDTARIQELSGQCFEAPHSYQGAKIWYPPEADGQYVMGIDPGQGKITQSVAVVIRTDLEYLRHEATLAGLIEPGAMGKRCKELGWYYNTALLVPEANGHGVGLCLEIKDYRRLYWRKDIVSGKKGTQIGWQTSTRTKPFMMSELARTLPTFTTHDLALVREIAGWREAGVGKPPFSMTSDDIHDAAGLAVVGISSNRPAGKRGYMGSSGFQW